VATQNTTSLPYIYPGDAINLRYEAFPYEKDDQFPGRILSVSNVPAPYQEVGKYNTLPCTDGVIDLITRSSSRLKRAGSVTTAGRWHFPVGRSSAC